MLDAFARGALDGVADDFAADAVYREAGKQPVHGRAAIAAHFARFAGAGVRWTFTVDATIVQAERACVVYRFGIAGGPGQPVRERAGCATVRLDDRGSIAEWQEYEG